MPEGPVGVATVIVAGTGDVADWFRAEYQQAIAAGLIQPALWVTGGTPDAPRARWLDGLDQDAVDLDLLDELADREARRVRVIRLVLAGVAGSVVDPEALHARLLVAIPARDGGVRSVLGVNLLVPTEDFEDEATVSRRDLLNPGSWVNVLASPEDRAVADARARTVEVNGKYLAHAVAACGSLGQWAVMDDHGPFDDAVVIGENQATGTVLIMRSASRTLAAPSAATRVAGQVLRSLPPNRAPYTGQEIHAFADHPDTLAQAMAKAYFASFADDLGYRHQARLRGGKPRYIGLLGLLRYLWDWIRGEIKRKLAALPDEMAVKAKGAVEKRVQKSLAGGDRSIFKVRLFPGQLEGQEVPGAPVGNPIAPYLDGTSIEWGYESPGSAWRTLRRAGFSLLDAGDPGVPIEDGERGLGLPKVVRDPSAVVGTPVLVAAIRASWPTLATVLSLPAERVPGWDVRWVRARREELKLAFAKDADPPPPELPAEERPKELDEYLAEIEERMTRCYLGRISQGLCDEVLTAGSQLQWTLDETLKAHEMAEEFRSGKRWRRLLLKLALLVAIAAILVAAVFLVPLAGVLAVVVLAFAAWTGILGTLKNIIGYFRDRFIAEHQLEDDESDFSYARRIRIGVIRELDRLTTNYELFADWATTMERYLGQPFGPSALAPIRNRNLIGPPLLAHQVVQGEMDAISFTGAVQGMAHRTFAVGWLEGGFRRLLAEIAVRWQVEAAVDRIDLVDPDLDGKHGTGVGDPVQDQSARRYVRQQVALPRVRFSLREHAYDDITEHLATLGPDDYIDRLVGKTLPSGPFPVANWAGAAASTQPYDLLGSIWSPAATRTAPASRRTFAPEPLKVPGVDVEQPVDPDSLLYQSVTVEWTAAVAVEDLRILADGPAATVASEQLRPEGWVAVDDAPLRTADEVDRLRSTNLDDLKGFDIGTRITPAAVREPDPTSPSYTFLVVVDGEPLRRPLDESIPFVVRSIGGPADGLALVREALQRVSDATGHSFTFLGLTSAFPGFDAAIDERSPLWIGWVFDDEADRFQSNEAVGLGGPRRIQPWNGPERLVGGIATVRAEVELGPGFGPGSAGNVLLHELGHAMNLGHVDDASQVMHPGGREETANDYGAGDLTGLWLLGIGRPKKRTAPAGTSPA